MINSKHVPRSSLALTAIFTVIYAVWAFLVANQSGLIHTFDNCVIEIICNHNPASVGFAEAFTNLGNTSTILVETIILFIVLIIFKQYAYAWFTAATMAAANGYNWVIKHAVARQRPLVHHLVHATGYSFPSGHSVGSATLFGILIILTILIIKSRALKTILIILWTLFPLLIGYTRIFTHVHYPSDVLGGWLEGITFVLLGYSFLYHFYLVKRIKNKKEHLRE